MRKIIVILLVTCMMLSNVSLQTAYADDPVSGEDQDNVLNVEFVYDSATGVEKGIIDSVLRVGKYTSLAIDDNGNQCISYTDQLNYGLKYAYVDSEGVWHAETVDESEGFVGKYTSLAIDDNGNPCISYYEHRDQCLKYAYRDSEGVWHIEMVDNGDTVQGYTSLALDNNGNPCISYLDDSSLMYTYRDSAGVWHKEMVDSELRVGKYTSLALDDNGNPCISYYDYHYLNDNLKYAYRDSEGVWHIETVDSEGFVGEYTSLALDDNGNPCISYFDDSNFNLKYAWLDSEGVWHVETVDSEGFVGKYTSLALDDNGNPWISYYDERNLSLKYAYLDSEGVWNIGIVDNHVSQNANVTGQSQGNGISLSINNDGYPCISYYNGYGSCLNFATLYPRILTETSINLGYVFEGDSKRVKTTIINDSYTSISIEELISTSEQLVIEEELSGSVIEIGESREFTIIFTPTDSGPYSGAIEVKRNDSAPPSYINVSTDVIDLEYNNHLEGLTVNNGSLSPVFESDTVSYQVDGLEAVNQVSITATLANPAASLTIKGEEAQSGISKNVSLEQGENLLPIIVTAADGVTQKAYILSINGTVDDADLSSLTLSDGNINFDKNTTDYYVSVGNETETIQMNALPSDDKAFVLINGSVTTGRTIEMAVGENSIEVMVVAQDGSTKTYQITVNRGMSDVTLSQILLSKGSLSPNFSPGITNYTAIVPYGTDSIIISPTLMDNNGTVTVNGEDATKPVTLSVGENVIELLVTGKDGVSNKTYRLTITRQEALMIRNENLPIGILGSAYQANISGEGGNGPYTWSATGLPTELTMNEISGQITGTLVNEGEYIVAIKVVDADGLEANKSLTLKVNEGCGNGGYIIQPEEESIYTRGYTDDGIPIITIHDGITGFKFFSVSVAPVTGHNGEELCVFVHMRDGLQIGINATAADFDTINQAKVGFNVKPGDVIRIYMVDDLTNEIGINPNIL